MNPDLQAILMNPDLKAKWDEAARTGNAIPVGDVVVCDVCNADYTESQATGGFIFGSYAYCPRCARSHLEKIREYGEEHLIRARAEPGEAFADFVRRYRGPHAFIRIHGEHR